MKIMKTFSPACFLVLLLIGGLPLKSSAAPVPWQEATFSYFADKQELHKVLESFAQTFGLELQASIAVLAKKDLVTGRLTSASPTEFLNQLSSSYGLQWFYFGGTLYVSRNFETATRSVAASGISLQNFRKALTDLGVVEPKFGWGEVPDRGVAMVSGPPAYVDLVAWAVATLPLPQQDQQFKVFKLKYATVNDRVISYRDQQITTPGVASILRNLISPESNRSGTSNPTLAAVAAPLRGMTPAPDAGSTSAEPSAAPRSMPENPRVQQGAADASRPVIQADSRLNALIIKDTPQRMVIYEELIALLDVPSKLVEIEAVIVDVNSSRVSELGIDWSARAGNVVGSFGQPSLLPDPMTSIVAAGSGVNPTTVIPNAGSYLMARIKLLEGDGDARIVSRPSVLTIDNLGALLDLSDTLYIRTTGERVASVVPITVGTTLKVTPHIILANGIESIHLIVDIEDGAIQDDRKFDGLPTIRRSTIGTQAVMGEKESLLIGGLNSESNLRQNNVVPGISNWPLIGIFFKKRSTKVEKRERLFLITPKIISDTALRPKPGG
jgi:type III secretion protein C